MSGCAYTAFVLLLTTPFPCPELLPGHLPTPRTRGVCCHAAPGQLLLHVDGVARSLVQDGKEIVIERSPGCDDESLRLFLLGSALGALLQQRGLLPLHGSAVQVEVS